MLSSPLLKSGMRELRHTPLRRQVQHALQHVAEAGRLTEKVDEPRRYRSDSRPAVDHPEGISLQGPDPALVVVRQELRLVRGDVHIGGAFGLARFAGKA